MTLLATKLSTLKFKEKRHCQANKGSLLLSKKVWVMRKSSIKKKTGERSDFLNTAYIVKSSKTGNYSSNGLDDLE